MPSQYQITEPHPTASKFIYSGRGGAGNAFKAPATTKGSSARGPASLFEHGLPQGASKFSSGRGGAGNIHPSSEKATFSFDDELERQTTRERKLSEGGVYHVGRGGAGNYAHVSGASARKNSSSSGDSVSSSRSGFFGRLSHTFDRN